MPERHDEVELQHFAGLIDAWAENERATNPMFLAVEREAADRRWLVRLAGEDKEFLSIWLTLGERTLFHECYVIAAPEDNQDEVYAYLLRANSRLYGMAFAIGLEEAIYLRGQVPLGWLTGAELDRIVGSTWQWTERHFRTVLRLGFASRFAG